MMIERLTSDIARDLLLPIIPLPAIAEELLRTSVQAGLPVIAGWDTASEPTCKLYLNASDASTSIRRQIRRDLLDSASGGPEAPHVIGLNLFSRRLELKLYEQQTAPWPDAPLAFAEWAATKPSSGFVRSWQIANGNAKPKAWFVALEPSHALTPQQVPGFDEASLENVAPFEPGPITSIGVSANAAQWTVYFKPAGYRLFESSLDPFGIFSNGSCEVGLYLDPILPGQRAYAKTDRWAISFRLRAGHPPRADIEQLMAWFLARVSNHPRSSIRLDSPPEPWHAVE